MSIRRITAVLDSKTTSGNDRVCLIVLADKADDDGYCWPGLSTIQEQMNCTRQTALNAINRLENAGELYSVRVQRKGSRYLVLPGLTDQQILAALVNRFEMENEEASKVLDTIHEKRNKSTNHTSDKDDNLARLETGKKSTNHTKKVYKLDQISLAARPDPSITVIEPSADAPSGAAGSDHDSVPLLALRDLVVEHWFDGDWVNAGWATDIAKVYLGLSKKKQYRRYDFDPPFGVGEFKRYCAWLKRQNIEYPTAPHKLRKWGLKFRKEHKPAVKSLEPTAQEIALSTALAASEEVNDGDAADSLAA